MTAIARRKIFTFGRNKNINYNLCILPMIWKDGALIRILLSGPISAVQLQPGSGLVHPLQNVQH